MNYSEIENYYAKNSFMDSVMEKYYTPADFQIIKKLRKDEIELNSKIADIVAKGMKKWALEHEATHWAHWFQPLTGLTAQKHEAFAHPNGKGTIISLFSGKDLLSSESDASSFPNGGLRSTFEARGLTKWDAKSPAFIREIGGTKILFIPTVFFSSNGDSLDLKTPLLRSITALSNETNKLLLCIGEEPGRIKVQIGAEQEYFLLNKESYLKRPDIVLTGRTLFGEFRSNIIQPTGHYYGALEDKIKRFMSECDEQLWKIGVAAKTEHKEVAPNQFELAVVYGSANIEADQNQLVMEILQSVADKMNLKVLLHEKPFADVNGSGKHINWSIANSKNENLLKVNSDKEVKRFLLLMTAFLRAVNNFNELLRASVAYASNDLRLGGKEAPPSIISVHIGEELDRILSLPPNELMKIKASDLKNFVGDRNRTSPIAFSTGKFEFRAPGSSQSISFPITAMNAAFAASCHSLVNLIKKEKDIYALISKEYSKNKKIVFNGNGYTQEWKEESKQRGLNEYKSTPEIISKLDDCNNSKTLCDLGIFTQSELESRKNIYLKNYCDTIENEVLVTISLFRKEIISSVLKELNQRGKYSNNKISKKIIKALSNANKKVDNLEAKFNEVKQTNNEPFLLSQNIVPMLEEVRLSINKVLYYMPDDSLPFASFEKLLFEL